MLTRRSLLRSAALSAAALPVASLPIAPLSSVPALAAAPASEPLVVTDALGRSVTIRTPIERVAVNFNFEEFTAIAGVDGWRKVVGISRAPWEGWRPSIFKRYAAVIPNLQGQLDIGNSDDSSFSAEKVIALKPDVLLVADWTFQALKTQRDQIEAAGIPIVVIDYNAQILERHLASTRAIGRIMGTEARAEELATFYDRQYADILARVARSKGPRRKVYVEIGHSPDSVGNSYTTTMWGKLITTLGAENIALGKVPGASGPLNAETVLAEDPDLILLAGSSWANRPKAVRTGYDFDEAATRASLEPFTRRAGWDTLKAVRSGNVNAIEHGLCRSLFDFVAMQYIAKRLYPAEFADVDPVQSFRDYHARFLPVGYSGSWMLALKP